MISRIDYYSIHNIITLSIVDKTGLFNMKFDNIRKHYENFRFEEKINNPDLMIEIGDFKPNLDNTNVVGGGKYYFREDYIYVSKEKYKGAKWRFEISGLDNKTTIAKIDCNFLGRLFITGNVIDFLIFYKLLKKGCPIIHASAVSNNFLAHLFSARGGGGKTTIALELVSRGYQFLGDNYIILHNGVALSFPTSLSIFTYNLVPIVKRKITPKEKIILDLKDIIYRMTKGYAKFFTKINPQRVVENIIHSSLIRTIFIILPSNATKKAIIEKISNEEAIKRISFNQMMEFPLFDNYIKEYSYLFPRNDLARIWEIYNKNLRKNLSGKNISFYKIELPQKYDPEALKKIQEVITVEGSAKP